MRCPVCGAEAHEEPSPNEGCEMFVAEDCGDCTECFDPDVAMFQCSANVDHVFYADPAMEVAG